MPGLDIDHPIPRVAFMEPEAAGMYHSFASIQE